MALFVFYYFSSSCPPNTKRLVNKNVNVLTSSRLVFIPSTSDCFQLSLSSPLRVKIVSSPSCFSMFTFVSMIIVYYSLSTSSFCCFTSFLLFPYTRVSTSSRLHLCLVIHLCAVYTSLRYF